MLIGKELGHSAHIIEQLKWETQKIASSISKEFATQE